MDLKIDLKILSCLFIGTSLLSSCSHLAYQPSPYMYSYPGKQGLQFEQLKYPSLDQTELCAWYFPAILKKDEVAKGTVIQFHGNAENMTSHYLWLKWMLKNGYNLFAFDYRGYGLSKGSPSQMGLNEDALATIRFVLADPHKFGSDRKVVLFGQSLGGAVLMRALGDLTSDERTKISDVIIQDSFYSYQMIGKDMLSRSWLTYIFQPLVPLLVSDEMSAEAFIPRISPMPLLVIHGDHDSVIPLSFGSKIFELAREPKKMIVVPGGEHLFNPPAEEAKLDQKILEFIESK